MIRWQHHYNDLYALLLRKLTQRSLTLELFWIICQDSTAVEASVQAADDRYQLHHAKSWLRCGPRLTTLGFIQVC